MDRPKSLSGQDSCPGGSVLKTVRCSRCSAVIMRSFLADHLRYVHGVQTDVVQTRVYEPGSGRGPRKKKETIPQANATEAKPKRPRIRLNTAQSQQKELSPLQQKMRARTKAIFESGRFRVWLSERSSRGGGSFLGGVKPVHVVILRSGLPSLGKRN